MTVQVAIHGKNRGLGALPVGLSLFLGLKALWLNLCFMIITSTILYYYKKRMGCITGDMLGAMIELSEAGLFLLVSVGGA